MMNNTIGVNEFHKQTTLRAQVDDPPSLFNVTADSFKDINPKFRFVKNSRKAKISKLTSRSKSKTNRNLAYGTFNREMMTFRERQKEEEIKIRTLVDGLNQQFLDAHIKKLQGTLERNKGLLHELNMLRESCEISKRLHFEKKKELNFFRNKASQMEETSPYNMYNRTNMHADSVVGSIDFIGSKTSGFSLTLGSNRTFRNSSKSGQNSTARNSIVRIFIFVTYRSSRIVSMSRT